MVNSAGQHNSDYLLYKEEVTMTKVIYRKDSTTKEIIAFLPEVEARWGNIVMYAHNGQHGEADLLYYKWNTKAANEEEYKALHTELNSIYDNELVIRRRLNRNDLNWR